MADFVVQGLVLSLLAGLSTIIGALIAIVHRRFSNAWLSGLLGLAAGVMVFISLDELLPTAHRYRREHSTTLGVLVGMMIMVATLAVLG